jgi:hypothetical protein
MWLPEGVYEAMPAACVIIGAGGLFLSSFHVVATVSALTLFAAAAVIRQMRREYREGTTGAKPRPLGTRRADPS